MAPPCADATLALDGDCLPAGTQPNGCAAGEVYIDGGGCRPPALPSADNYRALNEPNQATASAVIGELIGDATLAGLATPSIISFDMHSFASEEEFALSLGISGRYLLFSGSASGDFSRNAAETTVVAHFVQKMYEVVVEPPQTPDAFFSDDFTEDELDEQVELGRIGSDNVQVYVVTLPSPSTCRTLSTSSGSISGAPLGAGAMLGRRGENSSHEGKPSR